MEVAGSSPAPATKKIKIIKILNLIIKQIYFDQILSGKKTVEHREIRAKTAHKYIEYVDENGKIYKKDTDVPDTVEMYARPIKYDVIRFFVGYNIIKIEYQHLLK